MKTQFIKSIQSQLPTAKTFIIKPNWVSNKPGEYTEPEILDWTLEALPTNSNKIIAESYTPWRGIEGDIYDDIERGKQDWKKYKKQDKDFLEKTGIGDVLNKHNAKYVNITNEYWSGRCIDPHTIEEIAGPLHFKQLYSYIPEELFKIKDEACLISLMKFKAEEQNPKIMASLSTKNIFGLIPTPKRFDTYHGQNHDLIATAVKDINKIYQTLFPKSLWINEGIFTYVVNYMHKNQQVIKGSGKYFVSRNHTESDSEAAKFLKIDPKEIPYIA